MNLTKSLLVVGSILSLCCLSAKAAPLTYNVSAGDNDPGTFSFLGDTLWNSGALAFPAGTVINGTPLEVDVKLSHSLTLDNAPSGSQNFGYGLAFVPNLPAGTDPGTMTMQLLNNGVVITSQFSANPAPFASDEFAYGSGDFVNLPVGLVFDEVQAFFTDTDPNGVPVSEFEVGLPVLADTAPAPDIASTLGLFSLGLLGIGIANRRNLSRVQS